MLLEDSYNLTREVASGGGENEEEVEQRFLAAIRLFLEDKETQRKKKEGKERRRIVTFCLRDRMSHPKTAPWGSSMGSSAHKPAWVLSF